MKVYELMKVLEKIPAGSEVKIKSLVPLAKVSDSILKDEIDGRQYCSIIATVSEIETDREDTVILYAE